MAGRSAGEEPTEPGRGKDGDHCCSGHLELLFTDCLGQWVFGDADGQCGAAVAGHQNITTANIGGSQALTVAALNPGLTTDGSVVAVDVSMNSGLGALAATPRVTESRVRSSCSDPLTRRKTANAIPIAAITIRRPGPRRWLRESEVTAAASSFGPQDEAHPTHCVDHAGRSVDFEFLA